MKLPHPRLLAVLSFALVATATTGFTPNAHSAPHKRHFSTWHLRTPVESSVTEQKAASKTVKSPPAAKTSASERSTTRSPRKPAVSRKQGYPLTGANRNSLTVRTTAYTHTESDHISYANKNAIGTTLQYGTVRSAAADWSVFPVGTRFQIEGDPCTYVIDDYGSALTGTRTIDLYKPSMRSMNQWGVRHVKIRIVQWGSYEKSLAILKHRSRYWHVRAMVQDLLAKVSIAAAY